MLWRPRPTNSSRSTASRRTSRKEVGMSSTGDRPRVLHTTEDTTARRFVLQRFAWGAPDQLELAGTFAGLGEPPADLPVLILSGRDGTYRLPAAAGDVSGAPENGQPWRAAFVWQEGPAPFGFGA